MPSTDTRAALERELRDNADWLALGARQGMELSHREVADLAEVLTQAADFLARSAPKERGEGEIMDKLFRAAWDSEGGGKDGRPFEDASPYELAYMASGVVRAYNLFERAGLRASPPAPVEGEREPENAMRETLGWFRERGYTDAPIYRYFEERVSGVGRCPVCGWPFAESREHGCVPGDCSYRPAEGTDEYRRIRARRAALASHPVQGAGGGERSRDHIDALLGRLDEISRDCDRFEFGLPLYNDDAREAMIVAVREWVAAPAPSAPEEEP